MEIIKEISGQEGKALDETKTLSQSPPLLFDLTSLQREANNRFGFSAKNTVGLAQALYDRHKLLPILEQIPNFYRKIMLPLSRKLFRL